MTDDVDPIVVAGDDGVILTDERGGRCEHCGERFGTEETLTTVIPSTTLYLCPECQRWSE